MPTPKKAYTFTLNNYSEDEFASICRTCSDVAKYAIVGREVGESGTRHLQGYIMFKGAHRFNTVTSKYLPRCHVEVAAGSADANFRYCSKDGQFTEFGERPCKASKGRSETATNFRRCVDEGRSGLVRFAEEQPGEFYFSGSTMLRNYFILQPAVERPGINVEWCYGLPGTGKSRYAHAKFENAFVKEPRTKWWNGYMLEKDVIIDDFGPQGIDINHLLRWFDRYKCYVESKGGMLPLHAVNFVVTSNFSPEQVFSFGGICNEQLPALMRRIELKYFE